MSSDNPVKIDAVHVATLKRQDSDFYPSNGSYRAGALTPDTPGTPFSQLSPSAMDSGFELIQPDTDYFNTGEIPNQIHSKEVMTSTNPPKNKWRIYAIYVWQITGGFSDAAPGALLPYMESTYDLNYTEVSLIWMANAIGFIFVACLSHTIQTHLGKFKSMIMGTMSSIIMYAIILSGTIFPIIAVAFFFGGCGLAIVLAQANVFLARLDKLSKYLSFCHGSYGIGATISPLVATVMAGSGIKWNYFYLILLSMMIINCITFSFAFKGSDEDLAPWDHDDDHKQIELNDLNNVSQMENQKVKDNGAFIGALKFPITWIAAFFVLFYQGSEVSLAGWIVTFLLDYRHGTKSSGYVASGFWAGLTVGRLVIAAPMHKYFGARRSVFVISVLSIVLVSLTWAIPHVVADGVLISLTGLFVGPVYPLMISVVSKLLPRKIQVVSLTIITAAGSSGGAFFPFIIGLLSQRTGAFIVLPGFILLYSLMIILWLCLPNYERKETKTLWQKIW